MLARAFTAYFHLANVTEQEHRGRALLRERAERGRAAGRRGAPGPRGRHSTPTTSPRRVAQVAVRPVFTAHPTEVARRTTLDKLRSVAALLEEPDTPRRTRRLEAAVDLLWQTDELRIERPEPIDEARNGVYYLEGLSSAAVLDVLEELEEQLAAVGVELPLATTPLRFGTWMGGDRDGNPHVTPEVTREVLRLQASHGIALIRRMVNDLRRTLSVSERLCEVSEDLRARVAEMLDALPEVEPRYRRLNVEEPYRLFLTCVDVRLALTERRLREGALAPPGPRLPRRRRAARRPRCCCTSRCSSTRASWSPAATCSACVRTVAASGLTLATLDVREHAEKHHHAARPAVRPPRRARRAVRRPRPAERAELLCRELAERRPLSAQPPPIDDDGRRTADMFGVGPRGARQPTAAARSRATSSR